MTVEIRHLRFIIAAANHRSLRQAAETLRVKQSTLSRAIRTVERRLDLPLFERTNAGSRPTRTGQGFIDGARIVVETVDKIVENAREVARGNGGRLRIGVHSSLSAGHLRATLAAFREHSGGIDVHLSEGPRARLLIQVRGGLLDVAIVSGERAVDELEGAPVWSDKIVVAMPRSHALTERESIYWTDLAGEELIVTSRDPGPHLECHLVAKLAGPDHTPRIKRHDVTHATLAQLAGAGLGLALLCETSAEFGPHIQVREVRDVGGPTSIAYTAYFRPGSRGPALTAFLRLLRERYPSRFWT